MTRPILPLLAICLLAPALSQASEKDPLEIAYEKAQTVLNNGFEYGQYVLACRDLFIGNENVCVVEHSFHLVGIGYHVSGCVAAVELHAFNVSNARFHGFGFVERDNAVFAYGVHSFGNDPAYFFVACGVACDVADGFFVRDRLRVFFEGFNYRCGSFCDTFLEYHRVCACCNVFEPFADDCLSEKASGSGSVAGYVVCLDGYFFNELCAHVLERIFEFDVFSDGNAVVGDERSTVFFVKDHVSSFRSERNFYCIGDRVYACFEASSRVFAVFNFFSHIHLLLIFR